MSAEKGKLHLIEEDLDAISSWGEEVIAAAEELALRYAKFYDFLAGQEENVRAPD